VPAKFLSTLALLGKFGGIVRFGQLYTHLGFVVKRFPFGLEATLGI